VNQTNFNDRQFIILVILHQARIETQQ